MKAHLIRRGKHYAVKFYNPETRAWSHQSLKTTKRAVANLRFGQFIEEGHKKELLGELNVEPAPLRAGVKEFLDYMEANRSQAYTRLVKQFSEKWLTEFGQETLTTAITPRMIQRYAVARKKDKCKIKGTPIANATVNRDLAALNTCCTRRRSGATWRSRPDDASRNFVMTVRCGRTITRKNS